MKSATVRTVTGATVMAAVASAMLLAIGGDSGTPSRFELEAGTEVAPMPAVGAPAARPAAHPGSAASPARALR